MGTLKHLLSTAEAQVGTAEFPPNSNKVLYNTWYYGRVMSGDAYPWCMTFCQWVFDRANVKVSVRTASCTILLAESKRLKSYVDKNHLRPGDLVLLNFNSPQNQSIATHCGIVKSVNGIKMEVIEGNTSTANDTNGGSVMIRTRKISQSVGAFRPIFDGEEGLDMTKEEFLNSLTDKEAYSLLSKAMRHADTLGETIRDGAMKKAKDKKIINDGKPQGLLTREQMATILDRSGLL